MFQKPFRLDSSAITTSAAGLTALVVSLGLDLETEHQSCRGFSGMSGNVRVQRDELEVGPVVHESAILGTESDVFHKREINAATVNKCSFGLPQSSRHGLACIVGGVKHQRTRPGQNIGVKPVTARQSDDQCGCGLMDVARMLNGPPEVKFCCVLRS